MMKKTTLLILALFLLTAAQAMASGSVGVPRGAEVATDPLTVTETMKCIVTAIREDGTVIVRDKGEEIEHPLRYDEKTKVTAKSKKEFDGRKQLEIADLKVGHELRVTHRPATGEVLKIKVLKSS